LRRKASVNEVKPKKRIPVKRWIILALFAVGAYAAFMGPSILRPVSPPVVMPAENTGLHIGSFQITNSILATLLVDIILIVMALGVYRFIKSGKLVPTGFYNIFEAIFEFMWNSVEGAAGKWATRIFPIPATIFLLILLANMIKLVPGFESIGLIEPSITGKGYAPVKIFQVGKLEVYSVDKSQPVEAASSAEEITPLEGKTSHAEEALCTSCEIIPFFRGSSTDLNFTLGLAVATMILVQVYGAWALGPGYFSRFFPVKQLISGGIFGLINFAVGLLEIVLEIAKIISFAFRLFGNIFAGVILLSILGAMIPVLIPPGLYIFEIFFGAIQAYVFFLLAVIFISSATAAHHGEG
jgi:F-type H+-transporting ATPase subunit a